MADARAVQHSWPGRLIKVTKGKDGKLTLRVMTYNILDGGEGREQQLRRVIELIRPDVAILQEVYTERFLQDLANSLAMNAVFASGNRRRRVCFLSRLPIKTWHSHHPFPPIWRNVIRVEIETQSGQRLCVFGIHPMANLSVAWEFWRWWEAKVTLKLAQTVSPGACLIAGDFNAIAPLDLIEIATMPAWLKWTIFAQGNRLYHFSMKEYLSAGYIDCFRTLHPTENGYTLPASGPNARLDYILVNPELKKHLKYCHVVEKPEAVWFASDHRPVVAEFDI